VDNCVPVTSVSKDVVHGFIGAGVAIIVVLVLIFAFAYKDNINIVGKPLISAISAVLDFGSDIFFIAQVKYQLESPTHNQFNTGVFIAAIMFVILPALLNTVALANSLFHGGWEFTFFQKIVDRIGKDMEFFYELWKGIGEGFPLALFCLTPLCVLHFVVAFVIGPIFYFLVAFVFGVIWMAGAMTCADIAVHASGLDEKWVLIGALFEDIPQLCIQIAFATVNERLSIFQIISFVLTGWHIAFIFISMVFLKEGEKKFKNNAMANIDFVLGTGPDTLDVLIARCGDTSGPLYSIV